MVTRNSYAFGRRAGLLTALGIACGVQVHVLYTVLGASVIITSTPALFLAMKTLGAGYLIYLGAKSITNSSKVDLKPVSEASTTSLIAFRTGFFTNALNPKTMIFVVATYTQVVNAGSSLTSSFAYGLFISASHFLWFGVVGYFFSSKILRRTMLDRKNIVDKGIGTALIVLGLSLFFSNVVN
jgi:threonine/homoserine/homoserine lactone efflux protein